MITREQIPNVLDHPVYDTERTKIGDAKHAFFDDVTGAPEWVSVKTGLFGTNESFVPIQNATVVEDHLEVPYSKGKIKDAPHVDVDAGGSLSETEERRLYEHYDIDWEAGWQQGNRSGRDTRPIGNGPAGTARPADEAMTRSEERMHVGTERRETGRARLRKYVVTEEVQQTVPVSHEEVRVEREPITDADRDSATAGPGISAAEHEVTLHEERPVTQTETVPVERVRLDTDEYVEEETVSGEVRKERIEADLPDEDTN